LLMGRKVGSSVVRRGAEKAEVEGIFTGVAEPVRERIEEAGGSVEDEAIISRSVAVKGRARATAGGRTVPISVLTDISADLITLHGQSEQLRLKSSAQQRELLDAQAAKLGAAAEITRAVGTAHDLLLGGEDDDAGAAVDL